VTVPSADVVPGETRDAAAPAKKGENMSERFIAERLLSDRGGANFNPQVPRRVLDIPSPGTVKSGEADMEGKRLVIGRQVTLSGEIGGCERLIVEGKVDATLRDVKTLEVGGQGAFKGDAAVETAVIAGSFEGKLAVSGHLEIGPGAVVKGTVSYGTIAVANGGKLLGTVESA
jgi:cytoskeletal protein CcmA (bactofilin family)